MLEPEGPQGFPWPKPLFLDEESATWRGQGTLLGTQRGRAARAGILSPQLSSDKY